MHKSRTFKRVFVSGLCATALSAQVVTGRLTGLVEDAQGAAVPAAKISLALPGGATGIIESETTGAGTFSLTGIRPDFYDITVEKPGFRKYTQRNVKVDPGVETVLAAIRLEVGSVSEVVEVTESLTAVQVANAEVSTTVTNEQVKTLPLLDRSVTRLFYTQVGVTDGRGATVINGQRTTFTSVTLDGINIQDNFLRDNGIDFQPNRLMLDQLAEVTVSTSNTNSTVGGGSSQVTMTSRSGTNEYHGALYWYNRNNATAAGNWFDNRDGIPNAFLNQNQAGGSLGGPVLRNKLLFYANYEGFRRQQKTSLDRTLLTQTARDGFFTYVGAGGAVQRANILQIAGVGIDPHMRQVLSQIPGPENINNFRRGDSTSTLLRNSGGYSFLARQNASRDNVTSKVDYYLSPKNTFSGSFIWNTATDDRNDAGNDFSKAPRVTVGSPGYLASVTWRSNPTVHLTNELRGGFNLTGPAFISTQEFGAFYVDAAFMRNGALVNNPINTFRNQGRDTDTYNLSDNASYNRGNHTFQFGFQMQRVVTVPYNDALITPRYDLGISTSRTNGLVASQLPGISQTDLAVANNLLSFLGGFADNYTQNFNVTSRTSGFVNGATNRRNYRLRNYAGYLQDAWKASRRLSVTLGLRYESFGVVDERDGIALLPVIGGTGPIGSLINPAGVLDFAGKAAGRPYYNRDRYDFAPNIGLAWDVFGDGRTAVRMGYAISYVNDNHIAALRNSAETNSGLATTAFRSNLNVEVSRNLPAVPTPAFRVPRTFAENYALDSQAAFAMPDPNLRTPYVQQWNFGIQREIKGNVVEVRYLGHHAVKLFRGIDYNQVVIRENGFLDDFLRAYNNGNLARAATGTFNPNYNPNIAGSQPLTVFPRLASGGLLTNATVLGLLQRGEVGELANIYQINRLNGPVNFYNNFNALGNNLMSNYSHSSFNALQVDFIRRMRSGVQMQANYGFSKVLSDSLGDGQARFEAFLDNGNGKIERSRAPFDLRHQIKANGRWDLPFGAGHRLGKSGWNWLVGGWSLSGIMTWQSGTPFSILSSRGTLNRGGRSLTTNTANTNLTAEQLDSVVRFSMTGNGPVFIDPSAIGRDGRGTAPDGAPAFQGQAFTNPGPGALGSLQRRRFSGPWAFNLDASMLKEVRVGERHSVQLRAEFFNLPNHPTFYVGDETVTATRPRMDINGTTFGTITQNFFDRRILQFGLYYRF
jgi:hypothetical protein